MPVTYPVPAAAGRRYVVADVHGCVRTLDALLERLGPTRDDHLFFLGDYVHKGPASGAVLDRLIGLRAEGYAVHALRGNHDDKALAWAALPRPIARFVLEQVHATDLLDPAGGMVPRYRAFLEDLPYYLELDDCFLVHGGFDFAAPDPFAATEAMTEIRDFGYDAERVHHKKIIHGHHPHPLFEIMRKLHAGTSVQPLDNGCVYLGQRPGHGFLACLDLDADRLILQRNVDVPD